MHRIPVWDLPTRLFHWLLVVAFAASWLTHELGEIDWHFYAGYSLLGLLLFRLAWGFVGSAHARFADFIPTPASLIRYLRNGTSTSPGHNPLGALSVMTLLLLLLAQVISGLFNADDEGNQGPYHALLPDGWADSVGSWHGLLFDALLAMLALHLAAIAYYQFIRKQPLIGAMITGYKPDQNGKRPPVTLRRALSVLLVCGLTVGAILYFAPEIETEQFF